ncbi:MAG TPA: T9SS type A sorting domain-containing protein, partial [Bacteroidia bacterium]|nr:T9SS type A sorting domain-containing protein [Bacteroidia bacterium]
VVVVDNLSTDLVAGSYQLTGASHNVSVSRNGMNVIYNFQNIMLPDANSNEPMSHGFVSYKINAVNGLVAGTQISDFSKIYFDFNSPVTTNIAVVTMVNPTGINEQGEANLHSVYPNPVSDVATIQFTLGQNSLVGLELFDAAGRSTILMPEVMMQAGLHNTNLNANQLSEGLYLLKLNVNGKSSVMKVTVKH